MIRRLILLASMLVQLATTPGLAQTAARTMAQNARIEMPAPPIATDEPAQPPRGLRALNPPAPSRR